MRSRPLLALLLTSTLAACGGGTAGSGLPGPGLSSPTSAPGVSPTGAPSAVASPTGSASGVPTTMPGQGSASPTASPSAIASISPSGSPTGTSSQSVPYASATDSDAFYAQPDPFPSGDAPGTILASRSVTYAPTGGMPLQNPAWQLRFVSKDTNGNPIAALATVVEPLTPAVGVEPLDVVSYAEDSLGPQCAPSHSVTGSTTNGNEQAESPLPQQGLAMGWAVLYPDYEGPLSAYSSGLLGAQITLDAIRAAEHFAPLGLSVATPVGLTGYSGGAIPTAWAATIEANYAPELNIVAFASGGTPADPKGITKNIDANAVSNAAFFNLILSAVFGANRSYPSLITPILNAKGMAAGRSLANGCVGATTDGSPNPSGHLADYTTVADPVDSPSALALYPAITLPQPGRAPTKNVFVYHSQVDELIPIAGADTLVAGWCAAGSTVEYYRGASGDHIGFEATTGNLVYAYLASRFDGTATVTPPGTTTCN